MRKFKGWTTEALEAMEQAQLSKRLEASEALKKYFSNPSQEDIIVVEPAFIRIHRPQKEISENQLIKELIQTATPESFAKRLEKQEAKVYHVSNDGAISDRGTINTKPPAKPYHSPIIDELTAMVTPEMLAKTEKRMMKMLKKKPERFFIGTTFIGVDPALREGGFWLCIICRIDNTATFKSCKDMGEFVRIIQDASPAAVIVENSNLQKAVFDKKAGTGGAISVGKNQGVSQAATDIANKYSQIPAGISPKQKGAKVTNDVVFQGIVRANGLTLTGYKGAIKAAQDQRDAFMLALICEQQYKLHLKVKK